MYIKRLDMDVVCLELAGHFFLSIWNMKWGSMIDGLEYRTGRQKSPANLNSVAR